MVGNDYLVQQLVLRSLAVATMLLAGSARAEEPADGVVISGDLSALLVLGPVSGQTTVAPGASVEGPITTAWRWAGGARVGPGTLETFARIVAAPSFGSYRPAMGFELGLSTFAAQDRGSALLAEARAQSREHLWPVYVGWYAAALRFAVSRRLRLSFLETDLCTHVAPFGRFVTVRVGFVSAGFAL